MSELLGYADITTTLNTYSHVIPSMGGKTARRWGLCKEAKAESNAR
ncbi:MAG: hypothetical protein M3Q60_18170 [Actinomycetota bacterium]|nr:hypothetical protein [Actinomycetota bacterium]